MKGKKSPLFPSMKGKVFYSFFFCERKGLYSSTSVYSVAPGYLVFNMNNEKINPETTIQSNYKPTHIERFNSKELPAQKRNIKVELRTWNTLKNLKKSNETFNDVILFLLNERTRSVEDKNIKAIKYSRKTFFLETDYMGKLISVEFEYNDVKGEQAEFSLDLKIKKIFYEKHSTNPSIFFGVDNSRKHFHPAYLNIYLKCVVRALKKEFNISTTFIFEYDKDFENIARWRRLYYDYSLSEDSFIHDIEEPLRLSEEEKSTDEIKDTIKKSPSNLIWKIIK